jgi:hypothetical protein
MSAQPVDRAGLYRRATVAALVAAPLLLVIDNLLHPEELETGKGNEAEQLAEITEHVERWQIAHIFGFFAIILYAAAVLGLAYFVGRRSPRLGLWGGVLGIAGLIGLAGVIALDGFTWGTLGELYGRAGTDRATLEATLDEVQNSPWSLPLYTVPAAWIAGMILLAVGLARSGAVPVWSAALLIVASLMAGTETLIVSNAYFIAGAVALLVAGVAVALPLARMSDEEFAGA